MSIGLVGPAEQLGQLGLHVGCRRLRQIVAARCWQLAWTSLEARK
jgi:hypothetical protein